MLALITSPAVAVKIYRALLESYAAEHAARMTAMENAARNAGDMIGCPSLDCSEAKVAERDSAGGTPHRLVLAISAVVGFVFMLMELVWYRMLGPLLGGSTYTFGVILAVALLGIGLGGALFARWSTRGTPTLVALALTCGLEALLLIIPFAFGDRVALLTRRAAFFCSVLAPPLSTPMPAFSWNHFVARAHALERAALIDRCLEHLGAAAAARGELEHLSRNPASI